MTLRLLEQLVQRLKALLDAVPAGANIVTLTGAQELTNKTIDGEDNTLSNINISSIASVVARATKTGTQAVPNSGTHIIDFSTVVSDAGGCITTGAAWKFTAPEAGWYFVSAHVRFAAIAAAGICRIELFKNNAWYARLVGADVNANSVNIGGSTAVELAAGDFVDFRAQNGSATGDRNIDDGGVPVCHASVWRIA